MVHLALGIGIISASSTPLELSPALRVLGKNQTLNPGNSNTNTWSSDLGRGVSLASFDETQYVLVLRVVVVGSALLSPSLGVTCDAYISPQFDSRSAQAHQATAVFSLLSRLASSTCGLAP